MSEIGDWLGPAIAAAWILFRVLPRLFRKQSKSTSEVERTEVRGATPPNHKYDPSSTSEPPPPIEPR